MTSKAGTVTPDIEVPIAIAAPVVRVQEPIAASKSIHKKNNPPPLLPLGWTKIDKSKRKRKRKRTGAAANDDDDEDDDAYCCDDPICPTPNANGSTADMSTHMKDKKRKAEMERNASAEELYTTLRGKALFCLHSLDCTWFQGQFVPSQSVSLSSLSFTKGSFTSPSPIGSGVVKSMGMLARQRDDIDECLQCNDNGYREIDLTILPSRGREQPELKRGRFNHGKNSNSLKREEIVLRRLTCTGGDMLRIRTPSHEDEEEEEVTSSVSTKGIPKLAMATMDSTTNMNMVRFDAEQIITGIKVEPLVRRFFPNIVPSDVTLESSSSSSSSNSNSSSNSSNKLLDYLPDCAVVVGEMTLRLPRKLVGARNRKRKKIDDNGGSNNDDGDGDDDDLWKD